MPADVLSDAKVKKVKCAGPQCGIGSSPSRRSLSKPLSVTHGEFDARLTVSFPAYAGSKLILLGNRGTCFHKQLVQSCT